MSVTLQQYGLDQLDSASRSELAMLLWDSLDQESFEVPESHKALLEQRCAKSDAGETGGVTWDDFKKTWRYADASICELKTQN
jgi:putative addiction module component (TIGR02574 family)